MLSGSFATMARRVLRLQMEQMASGYEGQLRIHLISSNLQRKMGGARDWLLGEC